MAQIYWTGALSGCLDDPGNWDLGRLPTNSDDVVVTPDEYDCEAGDDSVPGAVTARTITITDGAIVKGGLWNGPVAVTIGAKLGASDPAYQPTFNGPVTLGLPSSSSAWIYRGVFHAQVDCYGIVLGGTFDDLLRLLGTSAYVRNLYGVVLADRFQVGSGPVLYADTSSRVALPSQVRSGVSNCGGTGSYVGMVQARAQLGM
jgi:hypothetical protein